MRSTIAGLMVGAMTLMGCMANTGTSGLQFESEKLLISEDWMPGLAPGDTLHPIAATAIGPYRVREYRISQTVISQTPVPDGARLGATTRCLREGHDGDARFVTLGAGGAEGGGRGALAGAEASAPYQTRFVPCVEDSAQVAVINGFAIDREDGATFKLPQADLADLVRQHCRTHDLVARLVQAPQPRRIGFVPQYHLRGRCAPGIFG